MPFFPEEADFEQEIERGAEHFRNARTDVLAASEDRFVVRIDGSFDDHWVRLEDGSRGVLVAACDCMRFADGILCEHVWAAIFACGETAQSQGTGFPYSEVRHVNHEGSIQFRPKSDAQTESPQPTWKRKLERIRIAGSRTTHALGNPYRSPEKLKKPFFVIDVSESLDSPNDEVVVDLLSRKERKGGGWGKPRRLDLRRESIATFRDPEDRALLELLDRFTPSAANRRSYYYYGHIVDDHVRLPPALQEVVLSRLAARGELYWRLSEDTPPEDARPLSLDTGPAWGFRIRGDANEQQFSLWGELHRGDETQPLTKIVLATAGGMLVFADMLGKLDLNPHELPWLEGFRSESLLEIPNEAKEEFLQQLAQLPDRPAFEAPLSLMPGELLGEPTPRLEILQSADHSPHQFPAKISFTYGEQTFAWDDDRGGYLDSDSQQMIRRDKQREDAMLVSLGELGANVRRLTADVSPYHDAVLPLYRMADIVYSLNEQGWIVETEGAPLRKPGQVSLSVRTNVDWFDVEGAVDFGDGVSASLPSLLAALRRDQKFIRLDDGTQGMLPTQWLEEFGYLMEFGKEEDELLKFRPSQALLLDSLLANQHDAVLDADFRRLRKRFKDLAGIKPANEPRGFQGELRPYQRDGLGWLKFLQEFRLGGCLADDMGLGKTVQVLALLQSRRTRRLKKDEQRKPSLVVAPKSLVFNWIDEAARFAPKLRILEYVGSGRKSLLENLEEYDVLITTYGTLLRDILELKEFDFDYAILDESQAIKNANSQSAKACRLIRADHRLAMTGTPVENHLGELWSLFEFLNPGMLGRSSTFQSIANKGRAADPDTQAKLHELARAIRPFMLRRTKSEVLDDLPVKTEQTLFCEMSGNQRKQYNELRDYYRGNIAKRVETQGLKKSKIHVLEALLRLRQAACHPGLLDPAKAKKGSAKLDVLIEHIEENVSEGNKTLVFSQFTSLLAIVQTHLKAKKIPYEYLDGKTRDREKRVKRFQADDDCPLFLISLKAGGHGLNLTAADYVYILDPWWNPAVEAQAVDRAHRIGQTKPVFAYRIICRDTVEDRILELQKDKRDLADAIVSANNSLLRELTADDLDLLLS